MNGSDGWSGPASTDQTPSLPALSDQHHRTGDSTETADDSTAGVNARIGFADVASLLGPSSAPVLAATSDQRCLNVAPTALAGSDAKKNANAGRPPHQYRMRHSFESSLPADAAATVTATTMANMTSPLMSGSLGMHGLPLSSLIGDASSAGVGGRDGSVGPAGTVGDGTDESMSQRTTMPIVRLNSQPQPVLKYQHHEQQNGQPNSNEAPVGARTSSGVTPSTTPVTPSNPNSHLLNGLNPFDAMHNLPPSAGTDKSSGAEDGEREAGIVRDSDVGSGANENKDGAGVNGEPSTSNSDDKHSPPVLTEYGVFVDKVEFRRREHLAPTKLERLESEPLGPIEAVTFSEILSCTRDQRMSAFLPTSLSTLN
jgi:hypothetical protein